MVLQTERRTVAYEHRSKEKEAFQCNPDEYLAILESWVKILKPKEDEAEQALGKLLSEGTLQVSELPSKVEAITIIHGTRTEERLGTVTFKRQGKTVVFEPLEWMTGDEKKGRFVNLRES